MNWDWLTAFFKQQGNGEYSDPFFKCAVVVGAITFVVVLGAVPAVLMSEDKGETARVFQTFFFALFAAVTFLTIAWRGRISERQIKGTEEKNIAELLQKGVEHISEESPAKQMAGIVSLGAVASDPNDKFAVQAMNILADYLQNNFRHNHGSDHCRAAIEALSIGEASSQKGKIYRVADRHLEFDATEEDTMWYVVNGTRSVNFAGGYFRFDEWMVATHNLTANREYLPTFFKVSFVSCKIDFKFFAQDCDFVSCKITRFVSGELYGNRFKFCDFSDCVFEGGLIIPDLRAGNNYFRQGHPAKADFDVKWESVLFERQAEE